MPIIKIMDKNLYYECYGEGDTIVFLNGIMMSTQSWKPFIKAFSKYRIMFVDLIDQGSSDKGEGAYSQDLHVEMLKQLFDSLGVDKLHMLGISYGGEVAMKFALKYEYMLKTLILSNTTSCTNNFMKDIEDAWYYAASTYDGRVFFKATMPFIYSTKFYEENYQWLKNREEQLVELLDKQWYDGFNRAIKSASNLNITDQLCNIKTPTLILGSDLDILTPIRYQEELHKRIINSNMIVIKDAGHAVMYEKPQEFASSVIGFLETYSAKFNII